MPLAASDDLRRVDEPDKLLPVIHERGIARRREIRSLDHHLALGIDKRVVLGNHDVRLQVCGVLRARSRVLRAQPHVGARIRGQSRTIAYSPRRPQVLCPRTSEARAGAGDPMHVTLRDEALFARVVCHPVRIELHADFGVVHVADKNQALLVAVLLRAVGTNPLVSAGTLRVETAPIEYVVLSRRRAEGLPVRRENAVDLNALNVNAAVPGAGAGARRSTPLSGECAGSRQQRTESAGGSSGEN